MAVVVDNDVYVANAFANGLANTSLNVASLSVQIVPYKEDGLF